MEPRDLLELFEYDRWATDRVLDAAERAGEAFWSERGPSVGSARELLTHLGDAQVNWLRRMRGEPVERLPFDRFATAAEVRAHCQRANAALRDFVAGLQPRELEREVRYVSHADGRQHLNTQRQILLQLFSHGVHHRAEASDLLSRAGFSPAPVELLQYYRERG